MEPQSPPKRMTRARAAAKASSEAAAGATTAASRAKASTAASKARAARAASSSTATATTASAAAKRKLRSEDIDDNDTDDELGLDRPSPAMVKPATTTRPAARGRPRKVAATAKAAGDEPAEAPARPRGRPAKKAATAATETQSRATASTRATRARKTAAAEADEAAAAEDAEDAPAKKKTTRTRATSSAASSSAPTISVRTAAATVSASTAASKPATKKRVTFEEPEKENIVPRSTTTAKGKTAAAATTTAAASRTATTAAGLRAKPARRATAAATKTSTTGTAGRGTRTASASRKTTSAAAAAAAGTKTADQAASDKLPTPLSPKKVTQVRMARDADVESEDELGSMDSIKPFMRSPTKPAMSAVSAQGLAKKSTSATMSATTSADASCAALPAPDMSTGMLASPARRPPPSPFKESLKTSPAKRLDGVVAVDAAAASTSNTAVSSKPSLLFSPAKRFPAPSRSSALGNGLDDTTRSPFKVSLLQTPAKRPASPAKAAILLGRPDFTLSTAGKAEPTEEETKEAQLQEAMSPQPKSTLLAAPGPEPIAEDAHEEDDELGADAYDDGGEQDDTKGEVTTTLEKMLEEMAADAAEGLAGADSPSRKRFPGRMSDVLPRNAHPAEVDDERIPATVDEDGDSIVQEDAVFEQEAAAVTVYEAVVPAGEPMDLDHHHHHQSVCEGLQRDIAAPPVSPPKQQQMPAPTGIFGLRAKDLVSCDIDSDSDDDTTTRFSSSGDDDTLSPFGTVPVSPCPDGAKVKTPGSRRSRLSLGGQGSTAKRLRMGKFGFTPLADKLNGWKASSPAKTDRLPKQHPMESQPEQAPVEEAEPSPVATAFFDEAMSGRSTPESPAKRAPREADVEAQPLGEQPAAEGVFDVFDSEMLAHGEVQMPVFEEIPITEEDLDLAQEANEMSLMEPEHVDDMLNLAPSQDDALSESSQEYGDENAIPIDPALLAPPHTSSSPGVPPVTPQRVTTRTFHTVSKVPLKPADESTPRSPVRRRSLSVSRLPMVSRRASFGASSINDGTSRTTSDAATTTNSSCGLTRNATVISYSPSKKDSRRESRRAGYRESRRSSSRRESRRESFGGSLFGGDMALDHDSDQEELSLRDDSIPDVVVEMASPTRSAPGTPGTPVTPAKSVSGSGSWSTNVTPARTPRHDVDPALLRGAVVFVDVHTTEGADASGIFVELLTQMGARCVKNWSWSPSSSPSDKNAAAGSNGASSKIGITHVVYKDGGKRTLEKVRESGGVVQCVGVSWVLDCERENKWLDEAPYYIDTSMVPRGGARRRKSMEPRPLSKPNGKAVSTPSRQTLSPSYGRECRTAPAPAPSTPSNRRDSALWVRTPEDEKKTDSSDNVHEEDGDAYGEPDWDMSGMLTPVPKTPAPEAIARYAAGLSISPSTPVGGGSMDDSTLMSMQYEDSEAGDTGLMTRTCPPKSTYHYHELGEGILSREKDERVLMRLMAARRKSLQFAPKVASPLSRTWN